VGINESMLHSSGKGASALGTWLTILQLMAGAGILGLPATLSIGGWTSMAIIVLVAIMTNYTAKALISTLYSEPRTEEHRLLASRHGNRLPDYPSVGYAAFGAPGRAFVHFFHKATLFGVATIFLILAGAFLVEGVGGGGEGFIPSLGDPDDEVIWTQRWTAISAGVALVPLCTFRTLREIAPLAALGMVASCLTVLIVVVEAALLYPITNATEDSKHLPLALDFDMSGEVTHSTFVPAGFATAFSTITLSFGGHAVMPSIEHAMHHREHFAAVANAAFAFLLLLYVATAFAGYQVFGDAVASPVLCSLPRDATSGLGFAATLTKLIIGLHVVAGVPLMLNPFALELEAMLRVEGPSFRHTAARTLVRTALVGAAFAVAVLVPFFGDVMSLVGALCLTMMVFVLPVVLTWRLRPEDLGPLERVCSVAIVLIGLSAGSIGSYQAIDSIVGKIREGTLR